MENRITFNKSILPNQDKVATMCRYKTKKPFQVISQFQIEKENSKFWVWVSVTSSRRSHIGIINLGLTGLEETRRILCLLTHTRYITHSTATRLPFRGATLGNRPHLSDGTKTSMKSYTLANCSKQYTSNISNQTRLSLYKLYLFGRFFFFFFFFTYPAPYPMRVVTLALPRDF